jgi:hypothetical protein
MNVGNYNVLVLVGPGRVTFIADLMKIVPAVLEIVCMQKAILIDAPHKYFGGAEERLNKECATIFLSETKFYFLI